MTHLLPTFAQPFPAAGSALEGARWVVGYLDALARRCPDSHDGTRRAHAHKHAAQQVALECDEAEREAARRSRPRADDDPRGVMDDDRIDPA